MTSLCNFSSINNQFSENLHQSIFIQSKTDLCALKIGNFLISGSCSLKIAPKGDV